MDDKKPKSSNGRIPKVKKVATGKKLAEDIRPLRSHAASDFVASTLRSKTSEGVQEKPAYKALKTFMTAGLARSDYDASASKQGAKIEAQRSSKRSKMTNAEQGAEFERLARDLGCDEDDEKFRGVLRKLAKSRT